MSLWSNTDTQLSAPKFIDRGQIVVVNIENTTAGRGTYSEIPSVTISAPASGLQATAIATCCVKEFTPIAAGTGYAVGDLVTFELDNSADAINPIFRIDEITEGGVPSSISVVNYGHILAITGQLVESPAVNVGDSLGADLTMTFTLELDEIVMTNPGYGYVDSDNVSVTFDPASTSVASAVYRGIHYDGSSLIFVDRDECKTEVAINSGLNSPGWWLYSTYVNAQGVTRHKAELKVHLDRTAAEAGDQSDDEIVPEGVIQITGPAESVTILEGDTGSISTSAVSNPVASLNYQWQVLNGSSWNNLTNTGFYSDVTTDTLVITEPDETINGKRYRLKVTGTGFKTTYSSAATLTVTPL